MDIIRLARLNESFGRAIVVTLASASAFTSASGLDVLVKGFLRPISKEFF